MIKNKNITLGLILGSGVEILNENITGKNILFEEKEGVHLKQVYSCEISGVNALVFKGRKHFYEGYSAQEITENVNTAKKLGVKNLLITNAAGGLNENFNEGDLMMITSHINFIDNLKHKPVSNCYSVSLQESFRKVCGNLKIKLFEGTYGCYSGPTYETRSEIRFQKKIGLDAAGMSTVPEVMASKSKGINVIALSVITNMLKENSVIEASHEEVLKTAKIASLKLNKVIPAFISELN